MSEIERKFLVDEPPPSLSRGVDIEQAYIAIDDAGVDGEVERRGIEVRVRKRSAGHDETHRLTVKSGSGVERGEIEIDVDRQVFDQLWPLAGDRTISKRRREIDLGVHVAELDQYQGPLDGLWIVEVEFATRAAAERFEPPGWFGDEVTGDVRWSNAALARYGIPST